MNPMIYNFMSGMCLFYQIYRFQAIGLGGELMERCEDMRYRIVCMQGRWWLTKNVDFIKIKDF